MTKSMAGQSGSFPIAEITVRMSAMTSRTSVMDRTIFVGRFWQQEGPNRVDGRPSCSSGFVPAAVTVSRQAPRKANQSLRDALDRRLLLSVKPVV